MPYSTIRDYKAYFFTFRQGVKMKKTAVLITLFFSLFLILSGCTDKKGQKPQENSPTGSILTQWNFDSSQFAPEHTQDCEVTVEDGFLKIKVNPGDPRIDFGSVDIPAPVKITMRMKSGKGAFGRVEWYYQNEGQQGYEEHNCGRFMVQHDDKWHEYEMNLSSVQPIRALRMDPGWQPGEFTIDWIRFEKIEIPETVSKAMANQKQKIILENASLKLEFDPASHQYQLDNKATGKQYIADGSDTRAYLTCAESKTPNSFRLDLYDYAQQVEYTCEVTMDKKEPVLTFLLDSESKDQRFENLATYPPAFKSGYEDGKLVFCNRSSGLYVDQDDHNEHFQEMLVYGNLSLDMPWVGVVEPKTGHGHMLLVESPCDAFVKLFHDENGDQWPGMMWRESLDTFRYPRKMSYRFSNGGGYINLAKMYRQYAQQQGLAVTLEQKEAHKPQVAYLKGAPVIWGSMDAWEFIQQARTAGIVRGVMSNVHHALSRTESVTWMNELGYVTNEYGNFSDILPGEPSQFYDDIEEASYHRRPGAGPAKGWYAADTGLQYYSRSTSMAMRAVKTYMPGRFEKYKFNGRFIDVSNAIDLFEDFHPDHTFDRRQDLKYRREVYEYVNSFNVVLGTEHGNDWSMDMVDYFEGALSGPFWWISVGKWNPGILQKAQNREDISKIYLKYGMAHEKRIPLWQLVYHDCATSTWYWGDVPGFLYEAAPELAARKDLFAILYGSVPLFWRDHIGYDWNKNRSRFLRSYHETCKLHEEIAYDKMLTHEFLTDDRAVQKTTFDSGTVAVVNFSNQPRPYETHAGKSLTLAPYGFWVQGPAVAQSKLLVDDQVKTRIQKRGYLRVESQKVADFGPVELKGLLTAFEIEPGRWNLVVENTNRVKINVPQLTSAPAGQKFEIFEIEEKGALKRKADYQLDGDSVVLTPADDYQLYAILLDVTPNVLMVTPAKYTILTNEQVYLYCPDPSADIFYTLDGSEPTTASMKYTKPFTLSHSGTVKARAFKNAGATSMMGVSHDYTVRKLLFESEAVTIAKEPVKIDLDISAGEKLVLEVDDANTAVFWDYADWANARLVKKDGSEVYLSDRQPVYSRMDHAVLGINKRVRQSDEMKKEPKPLQMKGKVYEKGLGMMSPAVYKYDIPQNASRFQCIAGIDDTAGENGRLILRISIEMPHQ